VRRGETAPRHAEPRVRLRDERAERNRAGAGHGVEASALVPVPQLDRPARARDLVGRSLACEHVRRLDARESDDATPLAHADAYEPTLLAEGKVIPDFAARREAIAKMLAEAAQKAGAHLRDDPDLLDEVTALVEYPAVYLGTFPEAFLAVPPECLILTMRANQKYFPLFDAADRLTNRFLIVSNMRIADPSAIIHGNERVVRPRLADAQFFFLLI